MSRQSCHGEVAALRVLTQQLKGIQRRSSAQDSQLNRPRVAAAGIPLDDWDALFSAVEDRLLALVGESRTWQSNGAAAPWQPSVLECVDALEKLRSTLRPALAGQGQVARDESESPPAMLPRGDAT